MNHRIFWRRRQGTFVPAFFSWIITDAHLRLLLKWPSQMIHSYLWRSIGKRDFSKRLTSNFRYILYLKFDVNVLKSTLLPIERHIFVLVRKHTIITNIHRSIMKENVNCFFNVFQTGFSNLPKMSNSYEKIIIYSILFVKTFNIFEEVTMGHQVTDGYRHVLKHAFSHGPSHIFVWDYMLDVESHCMVLLSHQQVEFERPSPFIKKNQRSNKGNWNQDYYLKV